MNPIEGARKHETHEPLDEATVLELRAKANEAEPGKERGVEATLLQQVFRGTTEVAVNDDHELGGAESPSRALWNQRIAG